MREPKFRGYSTEDKKWYYGYGWHEIDYTDEYLTEKGIGKRACLDSVWGSYECDLESIGEFIGLQDRKLKDIYEGDILEFYHYESGEDTKVSSIVKWFGNSEWQYPAFDLDGKDIEDHHFEGNAIAEIVSSGMYHYEVIGNI